MEESNIEKESRENVDLDPEKVLYDVLTVSISTIFGTFINRYKNKNKNDNIKYLLDDPKEVSDNRSPNQIFINTLVGYLGEYYATKIYKEQYGINLHKIDSPNFDLIGDGVKYEVKTTEEYIDPTNGIIYYKTLNTKSPQYYGLEKEQEKMKNNEQLPEDIKEHLWDRILVVRKKTSDMDIFYDFLKCKKNMDLSKHFDIVGFIDKNTFIKEKKSKSKNIIFKLSGKRKFIYISENLLKKL